MNKFLLTFLFLLLNCDTGNLKVLADLPKALNEVSGTEIISNSDLIWMLNDSGNKPLIYGLEKKGTIIRKLKIDAKNHDWEDLTSDKDGNLYIGDFGNNLSDRKNLTILKVKAEGLIEPLTVEDLGNNQYLLLAGQHRYHVLRELGIENAPAKIYLELEPDERLTLGYMSNEARKDPPAGRKYGSLHEQFNEIKKKLKTNRKQTT